MTQLIESEFEQNVTEAFEVQIPMVGKILRVQKDMAVVLEKNTEELAEVKELQADTLKYSQAWAGDVKKVMLHLGISEEPILENA